MKSENNGRQKNKIGRFILLICLCVLFAAVYFSVLNLEESSGAVQSTVMRVYAYADAILFVAFLILNVGFSNKLPTHDMFDVSVSDEKVSEIISKLEKRKKTARTLIYLIIPLTFTLFADVIILFWGDFFSEILKSIAGMTVR